MDLLGKGGYGFVRSTHRKMSRQTSLAVKVVMRSLLQQWQFEDGDLLEAKLLLSILHPNIVRLLEVFKKTDYYLLVRGGRLLQTPRLIGQEVQLSSSHPIRARELYFLFNQSMRL